MAARRRSWRIPLRHGRAWRNRRGAAISNSCGVTQNWSAPPATDGAVCLLRQQLDRIAVQRRGDGAGAGARRDPPPAARDGPWLRFRPSPPAIRPWRHCRPYSRPGRLIFCACVSRAANSSSLPAPGCEIHAGAKSVQRLAGRFVGRAVDGADGIAIVFQQPLDARQLRRQSATARPAVRRSVMVKSPRPLRVDGGEGHGKTVCRGAGGRAVLWRKLKLPSRTQAGNLPPQARCGPEWASAERA